MTARGLADRTASRMNLGRPWEQHLTDPVTSLSGFTTGAGTWSINTYGQCVVATSSQCRGLSNSALPSASYPLAAIECEVEIPSSFSSSSQHIRVGWQTGDTSGAITAGLRGDGNAYVEADASAALYNTAYSIPTAGTWVKLRWLMEQNPLASTTRWWSLWIDGTLYVYRWQATQTFSGSMYPYVVGYSTTALTFRFREFRAWGKSTTPGDTPWVKV